MRRERDGKGSGVEYDLYRQGRKKKRWCVSTMRWDVLVVWSLRWEWWSRERLNGLKGTRQRWWRWRVRWLFQWTVAALVVLFHPAVGAPCLKLKKIDWRRAWMLLCWVQVELWRRGGEVGVVVAVVVVVVVARDQIDMNVVMCVTWRWSRRGAAVSAWSYEFNERKKKGGEIKI